MSRIETDRDCKEYRLGWDAYLRGKDPEHCPYKLQGEKFLPLRYQWFSGYWASRTKERQSYD